MKIQLLRPLVFLLVFILPTFFFPSMAQAAPQCNYTFNPSPPTTAGYSLSVTLPDVLVRPGNTYEIRRRNIESLGGGGWDSGVGSTSLSGRAVSRSFDGNSASGDSFQFMVVHNGTDYCEVTSPPIYGPEGGPTCNDNFATVPSDAVVGAQTTLTINPNATSGFTAGQYPVFLNGTQICSFTVRLGGGITNAGCGTSNRTFTQEINTVSIGGGVGGGERWCARQITISGTPGVPPVNEEIDPGSEAVMGTIPYEICNQIPSEANKLRCKECYSFDTSGAGKHGIWTAVGCIKNEPASIIRTVITLGLGLGGGVALLMILLAGFMFSTSQGDPKKTGEARDLISSAVIGLLFIIFSVVILQFIGVKIFQIPGFGTA